MALMDKYRSVVDLANQLGQGFTSKEEGGVLKVNGIVTTQYEKNLVWDKIKAVGGKVQKILPLTLRFQTPVIFTSIKLLRAKTLA